MEISIFFSRDMLIILLVKVSGIIPRDYAKNVHIRLSQSLPETIVLLFFPQGKLYHQTLQLFRVAKACQYLQSQLPKMLNCLLSNPNTTSATTSRTIYLTSSAQKLQELGREHTG